MKVVKTKYMDFDGKEALNRSGIQQLNYGASLGNRKVKITLAKYTFLQIMNLRIRLMLLLVFFDSMFLCCSQFGCYGINDSLIWC